MPRRILASIGSIILQLQFLILLGGAGMWLQPISRAQTSQPPLSENPPLWTATPREVGYDVVLFHAFSFPPSNSFEFRPLVGRDYVRIQFLDSERLALAWLTTDETVKNAIMAAPGVPSHLHLSILDAKSGRQISHHEWACSSLRTNVAYTANRQWLLSSDDSVTLYSTSFEKIRDLQHVRAQPDRTFVSSSGRSFIVSVSDSQGVWTPQLRDSATFETIDSWGGSRRGMDHFVYSDRFVLARSEKPAQLRIRETGKSWKETSAPIYAARPVTVGSYEFLNDETLVKSTEHELTVATVSGLELFKEAFPDAGLFVYSWPMSATSTGGKRFALILDRMRGLRNEALDMYPFTANDRVMVYSLSQRGAIFSVKVKGSSPWYPSFIWNRIALSPDGLLLGIVSSDGVRVYALPPLQPEP